MMMVYGILLLVLMVTPFDVLLPWLFDRSRYIHARLDRPSTYIYFSKAPLVFAASKALDYVKGVGVPFIVDYWFEDTTLTAVAIAVMLVTHNWTPFLRFANRRSGLFVLWGVYTFMLPTYFWLFPVGVLLFSWLVNAPHIGVLLTLLSYGFVFWFYQTDPSQLVINFSIFVVTFLAIFESVFSHIEQGDQSLMACFRRRV